MMIIGTRHGKEHEVTAPRNERFASDADYSHWNEEASIVRAQEDRATEYYYEPSDYTEDSW